MTPADVGMDIRYALRTFLRAPLTALTVVTTVAIGLGLVAVVFTIFSAFVFRADAVRNPDELFGLERPRTATGERVLLTRPDYDALARDTTVFSETAAVFPNVEGRIDGRMMEGTLVTGNFFRMLGASAMLGRALAPDDDDTSAPRAVMVLSHRGWSIVFGGDPNIVGRTQVVNGFTYVIAGVMPEGFRGLTVGAPDYWAPLSLLGQFKPIHAGHEAQAGLEIVGRLAPGVTRESALAALAVWDAGRGDRRASERRGLNLTLEPRKGTVPQPVEAMLLFTPILFAFGLILAIGCANVANLLLARGVSRQREIGIRLSIGASRWRVVRQLLTESLLLAMVSAVLGFAISRIVLRGIVYAVTSSLAPELAETVRLGVPAADWRVVAFLGVGAVVSTMFFGLVPALQATRLALVQTIRGDVTRDARPGRARNILIAIQVTASALLLICSAVFLRSAFASATEDPGIRTSDTVLVQVVNEPKRGAMLDAIAADPSVAAVSASWPGPMAPPRAAIAQTDAGQTPLAYRFVSPEYFGVLDVAVVRGRGFTPAEQSGTAAVAVVSESTARRLWTNGDAVGQVLRLEPAPNADGKPGKPIEEPPLLARAFSVVGVARDVAGFRIGGFKEAGVYLPTGITAPMTTLTLRVRGDSDRARQSLLERLTAIDPGMGQVVTMKLLARMETYFLQIAFWVTLVLGALALVLTVSGLFGVLSYLVEQRSKEIGVRMALGATARNITAMVLAQSVRPVAIGLAIGGGLAAALAIVLLSIPDAAPITAIVRVADPIAYAASLACIVAACAAAALVPALRAARVDPWVTLRRD